MQSGKHLILPAALAIGVSLVVASMLAYPAFAARGFGAGSTSYGSRQTLGPGHRGGFGPDMDHGGYAALNLTVGQTISFKDTGRYVDASNHTIRGNASATLTFTVNAVYKAGYTLTLTSGTITIGAKTYSVSGGSAQLGPFGRHLVGQGTASGGASFLLRGVVGSHNGTIQGGPAGLDFKSGSAEYLVMLRHSSA